MFYVWLYRLAGIHEAIQAIADQQKKQLLECESIICELADMSVMGDIITRVKQERDALIWQQHSLSMLNACLEEILQCYDMSEGKILDYINESNRNNANYFNPPIYMKKRKFQTGAFNTIDIS